MRTTSRFGPYDWVTNTCLYSLSFKNGVVVGYDVGDCGAFDLPDDFAVPASAPPAQQSTL